MGPIKLRISPHLTFDGQCRPAFQMYQRIFGGDLATMLSYGDSPMASQTDSEFHDRIVHAALRLKDHELTGVDVLPQDYKRPQGFFVTMTVDDSKRAAKVFDALAEGGMILLPFVPTFWSPGFGVVVDRYGVPWEINSDASSAPSEAHI
jgi:PhnB protein